ncbi:MAG: MbnH family di-heme enzyme [Spirochaetota bacterium]
MLFQIFLVFIFLLSACQDPSKSPNELYSVLALGSNQNSSSYAWNLPANIPAPSVPASNPMSAEKVRLGRFLFYEKKLSGNRTMSCSSCHLQSIAFTDGKSVGEGSTGEFHTRNSMSLTNVAYNPRQTWNNTLLFSLEQQGVLPVTGDNPVELGLSLPDTEIRARLLEDSRYQPMFAAAFPGIAEPITLENILKAVASFQRTLLSFDSQYDKYTRKEASLTASEKRGLSLFNGEVAECFHCHGGFNFSDATTHEQTRVDQAFYHNNGLYNINGDFPSSNRGLIEVTGNVDDLGKFKAPTLRNIALTYPYMHDGSITCDDSNNPEKTAGATVDSCASDALAKVIDHYQNGGNNSTCDKTDVAFPCRSDSPISTVDTTLIRKFSLTPGEKEDLVNFLKTLTDETFITNSELSDPFQ